MANFDARLNPAFSAATAKTGHPPLYSRQWAVNDASQ
jgi:hypothetical protein